jgi:hydantoinase/carbamoylase family amidase
MPTISPRISLPRLKELLQGINRFGYNAQSGGYNRIGYSEADMAARAWFADRMRDDGLAVRSDAVGNLFGRFGPTDGPCIMVGSHLDTVPEGGAFDGSLGTAVALECVRALKEAGFAPRTAIEVVATAEEEGRFGGMLGSQAIAGIATEEWIEQASDADGVMLADVMRARSLDPARVNEATFAPARIRAFLELHIEQGPVLERSATPIGIATAVSGVCNLAVRFTGVANHSGTTPMDGRRDAFAGLVVLASSVPAILSAHGGADSRLTIGKVDIHPNFPHTVPGSAECVVNIRDTGQEAIRALEEAVRTRAAEAALAHDLDLAIEEKSRIDPVTLDARLVALLKRNAANLGLKSITMPSGAGHDAQTMQSVCPSALVFVPSRNGISHSPLEWTDWADIEKGASLMLSTLQELASD